MLQRWIRPISVATVAVVAGCGWVDTRSDFERDPFVMSHLTHQKDDPLYAGSDTDHTFEEEKTLQAASVSRKEPRTDYQQMSYRKESVRQTRAEDYSWVEGRLVHRSGNDAGWYLRYDNAAGAGSKEGELRLVDSPRIGLARVGDRVRVEGHLIKSEFGSDRYEIESIVVLGP